MRPDKAIVSIFILYVFSMICTNAFSTDIVNNVPCNIEFRDKLWDKVTLPLPSEPLPKLNTEQGLLYLFRFQKPGGFDPRVHLSITESIIRSNLVNQYPDLVLGMLQTIVHESVPLYESILDSYPELLKIKRMKTNNPTLCRTKKEITKLKQSVSNYVEYLLRKQQYTSTLKDWDSLVPLSPILSLLSDKKRRELSKKIYQSITSNAQLHPDGQGIFYSKLLKFTKQPVGEFFGKERRKFTDLTYKQSQGSTITPIILGTDPIDGDATTKTYFGFYQKTLSSISINKLWKYDIQQINVTGLGSDLQKQNNFYRQQVRWRHDGKELNGTILIRRKDGFDYLPKGTAPRYQELWKDSKLTGLIIISDNFSKKGSAKLIDNYREYYKAAGFKFSSPIKLKDTVAFLKRLISSGELDYLIKEAHSQGDEKNMFRTQQVSNVIEGFRKHKQGKNEKIYLVYSTPSRNHSQRLSPQEMEIWMKERNQNGGGQLLYISSSCYSEYKVSSEIAAIASPLFVNISSNSSTTIFVNVKEDAKKVILDGIREGQTYQEIRMKLHQTPTYKQFRYNDFIFPDDPRYIQKYAPLRGPIIDVQISIKDDSGKPYHLDEQVN